MRLIGEAQPCRVFYKVGSSATLGTGSQFVGTIMALTSITATTATSVQGRLLARNGSVTLDSNRVTRPTCLPAATTSTTASATGSTVPFTSSTVPATTGSTLASTATTTSPTRVTPATVTTKTTIRTVTAATTPGRNPATTATTKAPAQSTTTRLATTGGQFEVLVAAALLAMVAGAMILCGPRLRADRPGSRT